MTLGQLLHEINTDPLALSKEDQLTIAKTEIGYSVYSDAQVLLALYCASAIKFLNPLRQDKILNICIEIELLALKGLDKEHPEKFYYLESIPGKGLKTLHLLAILYVGFRKFYPDVKISLDMQEEYELATMLMETVN